jgi:hypothetical protein
MPALITKQRGIAARRVTFPQSEWIRFWWIARTVRLQSETGNRQQSKQAPRRATEAIISLATLLGSLCASHRDQPSLFAFRAALMAVLS